MSNPSSPETRSPSTPPTAAAADPALSAPLAELAPEISRLIDAELARQRGGLEMIASENHTFRAVMEAQGSVLTNKYAEGYPGRRYYGGCEHVDEIERLAIARAKDLFGAGFANVQPHSGAQANAAVMHALIRPGDRVLGLDLAHGGHLTHGMRLNFSGRLYDIASYGVAESDHRIDMDEVARIARETQPRLIIAGWSAYPRQLDFARFRVIADEVGALLMVDMAHIAGLVATGLHPSPLPHAHVVTTTTHKTLGGPRGGMILTNDAEIAKKINSAVFPGQQGEDLLARIDITVNRNAVPFDPRPPMVTSGLRIGTPALATRGFDAEAFTEVADIIAEALIAGTAEGGADEAVLAELGRRVSALADAHPLYPHLAQQEA